MDAANKAPYNPRAMEKLLSKDGQEVLSKTLPKCGQPNVRLAGKSIERPVIINCETGEIIIQRVIFDQRGFPIFDPYVKVETRISGDVNLMSRDAHMRAATRQLRSDIETGIIDKNIFDKYQLEDIMSGDKKIRGFTWHYHQDVGRMQLVPTSIHKWVKHVGGFDLWGKK